MRFYSDEDLIAIVRELAEELGRIPTSFDMDVYCQQSRKRPSHTIFFSRFGTWNATLEAAGFDVESYGYRWTDEMMLEALRKLAKKLGRSPLRKDIVAEPGVMPCSQSIWKRFGSWNAALEKAGLEKYYCYKRNLTDEDLIQALQELAEEVGRVPTVKDLERSKHKPSHSTYMKRFGNWHNALEAAGFGNKSRFRVYTDAELLDNLRKITVELGYLPEKVDVIKTMPIPSLDVYIMRFGSLEKALEKARLGKFMTKAEWRKDQALRQLKRLAVILNKTPSPDNLGKASGTPCYRTYVKLFGSWEAVLSALEEILD